MTLNLPIPKVPQRTNKNEIEEDENSEDDSDYIPEVKHRNGQSESSDSSDSESDTGRPSKKKQKLAAELSATTATVIETGPSEEEQRAQKERTRQQLWEEFQASLMSPNASTIQSKVPAPQLIKVVKKYRFAGEDVIKIEQVPEDSPDAKKWPRWNSSMSIPESATSKIPPSESTDTPSSVGSGSTPADANTPSTSSGTPPPLPPPRATKRTRKSLDAMFASATASATASALSKFNANADAASLQKLSLAKGQKLTTLDKSAMDWREHVQSIDEVSRDEMEKNRRGGGSYLSKVEFLQRVEERAEDVAEAGRAKRRRP